MKQKKKIIPKEKAVFWLDNEGNWQNEHGRFEHPKIIRFFHASIQKDADGYFVCQTTETFEEKVYFRYEDTALFVFEIHFRDQIELVLNTGKTMILNPEQLAHRDDFLYLITPDHRIKFNQKTLISLSKHLEEKNGCLWLNFNDQRWKIKSLDQKG